MTKTGETRGRREGLIHEAGPIQRRDGDPTDVQFCIHCGQQLSGRVVERLTGWPEGALIEIADGWWCMKLTADGATCQPRNEERNAD